MTHRAAYQLLKYELSLLPLAIGRPIGRLIGGPIRLPMSLPMRLPVFPVLHKAYQVDIVVV